MIDSGKNHKIRYVSLVLSGVALGLTFPRAGLWPLAWLAVAPLLVLVAGESLKTVFRFGLVYGAAYFTTALYWVDHSIRVYGHLPLFLSAPAVLLLAMVMALYVAVFSMLYSSAIGGTRYPAVVVAPVLWVSMDLARTYLLTGFPWASVGYSQIPFLHLIQIADVTGVYGVTFLVVAANGAVADLVLMKRRKRSNPLYPALPAAVGIAVFVLVFVGSLLYGQHRLGVAVSTTSSLRVTVIQGNIDQNLKWEPTNQTMILDRYFDLTRKALTPETDLVIWPETAIPFVYGNDPERTEQLREFVRSIGKPLLTGAVEILSKEGGEYQLANSALFLGPDGGTLGTYRKIHLVPFGEYVPLGLPLSRLVSAIGNFSRGTENTVFRMGDEAAFSTLICYEIIFPELVRQFSSQGARFLTTITNDAWFGTTSAPYQHFDMAVFRAIENRMPVVRAANTGISGVIDDRGRIIRSTPLFAEAAFSETVRMGGGKPSFYTRFGNVFGYLCMVAAIMLITFKGERDRWEN